MKFCYNTSPESISHYDFCYNRSFAFLKQSKDLDLSYKTDLDFFDCFERKQTLSYNRRNTVFFCKEVFAVEAPHICGAPVAQLVKCWPTDLVIPGLSPI